MWNSSSTPRFITSNPMPGPILILPSSRRRTLSQLCGLLHIFLLPVFLAAAAAAPLSRNARRPNYIIRHFIAAAWDKLVCPWPAVALRAAATH